MTQKFCQTCGGKVAVREDGAIVHQPRPAPPAKPRFEVVEDILRNRILILDNKTQALLAVNKEDFALRGSRGMNAYKMPRAARRCRCIPCNADYGQCTRDAGHEGPCAHELTPRYAFKEGDPMER